MKKSMKTNLTLILATASFIALCLSSAVAEEKAPIVKSTENKPSTIQALDQAHEAAGAEKARVEDMDMQASEVTDDEGMAEEDMEMPEEDLEEAPDTAPTK
jgi:hypothetical protein